MTDNTLTGKLGVRPCLESHACSSSRYPPRLNENPNLWRSHLRAPVDGQAAARVLSKC